MMEDTIRQLQQEVRASTTLDAAERQALLELVTRLESEVQGLSQTHADEAASVARFSSVSAGEALRPHKNERLVGAALGGLSASVEQFEESHPRLVQVVEDLSRFLSALGI